MKEKGLNLVRDEYAQEKYNKEDLIEDTLASAHILLEKGRKFIIYEMIPDGTSRICIGWYSPESNSNERVSGDIGFRKLIVDICRGYMIHGVFKT